MLNHAVSLTLADLTPMLHDAEPTGVLVFDNIWADQLIAILASNMWTREPPTCSREQRKHLMSPPRNKFENPHHAREKRDSGYDARTHEKRQDFQAGTGGTTFPPCAICLGRHKQRVVACETKHIWDHAHHAVSWRENKLLFLLDGRPLCHDWQMQRGCTSNRHDERHLCSGCTQPSHEAINCS